jgi:hypothetical protein
MNQPPSGNQPCRTLGDVLRLVEQRPGLLPSRRRDFASAINTVSRRFLQRGPDQVPADARVLRVQLSKVASALVVEIHRACEVAIGPAG